MSPHAPLQSAAEGDLTRSKLYTYKLSDDSAIYERTDPLRGALSRLPGTVAEGLELIGLWELIPRHTELGG